MKYLLFFLFCAFQLPAFAQEGQDFGVYHLEFFSNDQAIYKKGSLLIPDTYLKDVVFIDGLVEVTIIDTTQKIIQRKSGFVNTKGKFIIPPVYTEAEKPIHGIIALKNESGYWVFFKNDFLDLKGNKQILEYQIASPQTILISQNHKWGALLLNGKKTSVINPAFKNLIYVSDHSFKAKQLNCWTLRNQKKDSLKSFFYDEVSFFNDTLLLYKLNNGSGLINHRDEEITEEEIRKVQRSKATMNRRIIKEEEVVTYPKIYERMELGRRILESKGTGKEGIADSTGKKILMTYDSIQGPYESIFIVYHGKNIGLVNEDGVVLSELSNRFEKVFPYKEGRAKVLKAGKFGFIDQRGNVRVAPQYETARDFNEGLAALPINGKWGFIDKDENIVVQPHYQKVYDFQGGIARGQVNGKWYFISKAGERLSNAYDEIKDIKKEKWLTVRNKKVGLADKSGKELLAPRYDQLEDLENGWVIVKKLGRWGVVDYNENFVFPIEFDYVSFNKANNLFLIMKEGKEETLEISR